MRETVTIDLANVDKMLSDIMSMTNKLTAISIELNNYKSGKNIFKKQVEDRSTLTEWIKSDIIFGYEHHALVSQLYDEYLIYTGQNGLEQLSLTKFSPAFIYACNSLGHKVERKRRSEGTYILGCDARLIDDGLNEEPSLYKNFGQGVIRPPYVSPWADFGGISDPTPASAPT